MGQKVKVSLVPGATNAKKVLILEEKTVRKQVRKAEQKALEKAVENTGQ